MSDAAAEQIEVEDLYVALLNEGTDVWRPTRGRKVGRATYEVLPTDDYDPDDETWEFLPGTVVIARLQRMSSGVALVAWKRAPTRSQDASTEAAERIAAKADIEIVASGGLRLIAYEETGAFLDSCEAENVGIHYVRRFRLEDGAPVVVFSPEDIREGPEPVTRTQSVQEAKRYVERVAAQDLWFDFVLEEHGRWGVGDWRTTSSHMPALPSVDPGLSLVSIPGVSDMEDALSERGHEAFVWLAEVAGSDDVRDPRRLLRDLAVLALGEELPDHVRTTTLDRLWLPMARDDAITFLARAIGHDLAYGDRVLSEREAQRITDEFVGLFSDRALFFNSFTLGDDGLPQAGTPLLDATMEAGVGVTDGVRVGILLVTGED